MLDTMLDIYTVVERFMWGLHGYSFSYIHVGVAWIFFFLYSVKHKFDMYLHELNDIFFVCFNQQMADKLVRWAQHC